MGRDVRAILGGRKILSIAIGLVIVLLVLGFFHLESVTRIDLEKLRLEPCKVFYDRHGRMLRFATDSGWRRHLWVDLETVPREVSNAFLAAEDHRFFSHHGIDFLAVPRALRDNLAGRGIVSGASTVTQQLIRMAYSRERTLAAKGIEAVRALRLERALDKDRILALYLNRAPLGNNLYGIEAASRFYFGRPCSELATAEAAVLASLPKAPTFLNPYGPKKDRLLSRKEWVLSRMQRLGFISAEELERERQRPILFRPRNFPMEAPHFVDYLMAKGGMKAEGESIRTTIDLDLQHSLEGILHSHRHRIRSFWATQAAAVLVRNSDASVLALAGSIEYSSRYEGFNNGAQSLRSPGSALKPFLYALALDAGYTASSTLPDIARRYRFPGGNYAPLNFNRQVYGPMPMRDALANSLNLSSVWLLNQVGSERFYRLLDRMGLISSHASGPEYYGLGIAIGNAEVTAVQMASAYAALANGGLYRPARFVEDEPQGPPIPIVSRQAAWIVTNMLSEPASRTVVFGQGRGMSYPYRVAIKTGTSNGYRDCWAVGYTRDYTAVVWTGNFDGRATAGLSGARGAAPILADILEHLYRAGDPPPFEQPPGIVRHEVCSFSGMTPGPGCPHLKKEWFIEGREPDKPCTYHSAPEGLHRIPPYYASWLHDRFTKGTEGRFRLSGFDEDLEKAFAGEGKATGETVSGSEVPLSGPVRIAPADDSGTVHAPPVLEADDDPGLKIVSPLDGDRYVMDSRLPGQSIRLSAFVTKPVREVVWYVNGVEFAAEPPPYTVEWPLRRGRYTITASGPDRIGDSVEIVVE